MLKVLNRQVCSRALSSFSQAKFCGQEIFCEKLCSIIIWFWYQIVSCFFCCSKFNIPIFNIPNFVHDFSKNCIIYQIKKVLSDCNWTWTQNQLVHKRTLNHLSLRLQISRLIRVRSFLTFRHYRVWIHSETRMWHDKNIKLKKSFLKSIFVHFLAQCLYQCIVLAKLFD